MVARRGSHGRALSMEQIAAGTVWLFMVSGSASELPKLRLCTSNTSLPQGQAGQGKGLPLFDALLAEESEKASKVVATTRRPKFDLATWNQKTSGGLTDLDRKKLGEIYGAAESVFEWGLGESTYIAAHVAVPRYSGVDSDPAYVNNVHKVTPVHFRLSYADIGATHAWGYPAKANLAKKHPGLPVHAPGDGASSIRCVHGRRQVETGMRAPRFPARLRAGGGAAPHEGDTA